MEYVRIFLWDVSTVLDMSDSKTISFLGCYPRMQCLFQEWDMWQKVNKNHSRMEVQPKGWGFTSVAPDIVAAYSWNAHGPTERPVGNQNNVANQHFEVSS